MPQSKPRRLLARQNRRHTRLRERRQRLKFETLEDRRLLAVAVASSVSDTQVLFETDDQSMFTAGSGAVINPTFNLSLSDLTGESGAIPGTTIGGFVDTPAVVIPAVITPEVPSTLITPEVPPQLLTPAVPRTLLFPATPGICVPLIGCSSGTPAVYSPAVPAVYSPRIPAVYSPYIPEVVVTPEIEVIPAAETGLELDIKPGKFDLGFAAGVEINPGQVDVDYSTDLSLSTDVSLTSSNALNVREGDQFTINTSELVGAATMATDFPDVSAWFGLSADIDLQIDLNAKALNASIFDDTLIDFDTNGEQIFEVLRVSIGQGEGIDVKVFDSLELSFLETGQDLPIPAPVGDFIGGTVFIPELDTAPPTTSKFENGQIINTRLDSLTQANTGETEIDFLRAQLDLDSLLTAAVSGGSVTGGLGVDVDLDELAEGLGLVDVLRDVGLPVPKLGKIELFLVDAQLQALFGIGQTMKFTPNLQVDLNFSQPTMVETSPGSGSFSEVTTKRVRVGDDIQVVHPGGDLTVDPIYTMAGNQFSNDTDIRFRPNLNLRAGGYNIGNAGNGILPSIFDGLGIPLAAEVASTNLPGDLGGDLSVELGDIFNDSFTMEGFNTRSGSNLILPALEAPTLVLSAANSIEAGNIRLDGTITDQNVGDFFSIEIDWADGTQPQTIQFPDPDNPSSAPLPTGVTWNPETGQFTVEHEYSNSEPTYRIKVDVTDSTSEKSDKQEIDTSSDPTTPLPVGQPVLTPRIIDTETAAGDQSVPGDGVARAVLLSTSENTTLSVVQVGADSSGEEITVMDEDRVTIFQGSLGRGIELLANKLYAIIFSAREEAATFSVQSSEGEEAIGGNVPTNVLVPTDINADGKTTAFDALMVINKIGRYGINPGVIPASEGRFFDANRDGRISAGDALRVINQLPLESSAADPAEAESIVVVAMDRKQEQAETQELNINELPQASRQLATDTALVQLELAKRNTPVVVTTNRQSVDSDRSVDQLLSDASFLEQLVD